MVSRQLQLSNVSALHVCHTCLFCQVARQSHAFFCEMPLGSKSLARLAVRKFPTERSMALLCRLQMHGISIHRSLRVLPSTPTALALLSSQWLCHMALVHSKRDNNVTVVYLMPAAPNKEPKGLDCKPSANWRETGTGNVTAPFTRPVHHTHE